MFEFIWHFLMCGLVRNWPSSLTAKLAFPILHTADMSAA